VIRETDNALQSGSECWAEKRYLYSELGRNGGGHFFLLSACTRLTSPSPLSVTACLRVRPQGEASREAGRGQQDQAKQDRLGDTLVPGHSQHESGMLHGQHLLFVHGEELAEFRG